MQMREKVEKSRNTVFFQWFLAPEVPKVGSLKLARWEMKNCTPLWREARFEVKMYKIVQNTTGPDHFWTLTCRKSGRRWSAKHISKSKCTKHTSGPLLGLEMLKECTPWWRETHFEVKMDKTYQLRTAIGSWDVEKVHTVVAWSTFRSQNAKSTICSCHFWRFRCRFAWQAQGIVHLFKSEQKVRYFFRHFHAFSTTTTTTPKYTPIHYTTLQIPSNTATPALHSTTLHSTTVHSITLHYSTLHSTTLHYIALRYTTLPSTTLHYTTLHSTTTTTTRLHSTTLHYTPRH